jgi:molecular chaperone DnaK
VRDFGAVLLVGGSTRLTLVRRRVQEYFGRADFGSVNPDEVVAIGAALQAAALAGREQSEIPKPPALSRSSRSPARPLPPPVPPPPSFRERLASSADAVKAPETVGGLGARGRQRTKTGLGFAAQQAQAMELRDPPAFSPPPGVSAGREDLDPLEMALPLVGVAIPEGRSPTPPPEQNLSRRETTRKFGELPLIMPPDSPPREPARSGVTESSVARRVSDSIDESALPIPGVLPQLTEPEKRPASSPTAARPIAPPPPIPTRTAMLASPPVLVDVTPLTLSVETVGGFCDPIITRNTAVPCERTQEFATAIDNQSSVRVRISQGESSTFAQNTVLGEVELSGLRPAPRGAVRIAVTFALDADGILKVRARDLSTGRSAAAEIRLLAIPSADEVSAMATRQAGQVAF